MTTATHLSTLLGGGDASQSKFSTTQQTNAITSAQALLGTSDGDSDPKDMATAMRAMIILYDASDNHNLDPSTRDDMMSNIRSLMAEDEKSKSYKVIHYKKPSVDWRS